MGNAHRSALPCNRLVVRTVHGVVGSLAEFELNNPVHGRAFGWVLSAASLSLYVGKETMKAVALAVFPHSDGRPAVAAPSLKCLTESSSFSAGRSSP